MLVTPSRRIFVIGDLNVDYRLHVNEDKVSGDRVPGGTAINAAIAFRDEGFTPVVLGAIGQDEHGDFLESAMERHGISASTVRISAPTGSCALVSDQGFSRRLTNADTSANAVKPIVLAEMLKRLAPQQAEPVFVASHMLVRQKSADCAQFFAEIARLSSRVVVDLLPHDLADRVNWLNVQTCLKGLVFLLISELRTLRGLHAMQRDATPTPIHADWSAAFDDLGARAMALRYGRFGIEMESFAKACEYRNTMEASSYRIMPEDVADPHRSGLGDRLTARLVRSVA